MRESESPQKADRLCCVLVHAADVDPPASLLRALEAKKIEITATTDVFRAIADMCRLEHDGSVALPILTVVEPSDIAHAAQLYESTTVYAPRAVLWMYAAEPHEQIREVRESDLHRLRGTPQIERSETVSVSGGPALQFIEVPPESEAERDAAGGEATGSSGARADSSAVLTDEEMELLLADDFAGDWDQEGSDP